MCILCMGMACSALVIDVFARKIVSWLVSTSMTTSFMLDALSQTIRSRMPAEGGLIHHSGGACSICPSATQNGWPESASIP